MAQDHFGTPPDKEMAIDIFDIDIDICICDESSIVGGAKAPLRRSPQAPLEHRAAPHLKTKSTQQLTASWFPQCRPESGNRLQTCP